MKTNGVRDEVFAARVGLGLRELDGLEHAPDASLEVLRRLAQFRSTPPRPALRWPALVAALLALAVTGTLLVLQRSARDPDGSAGTVVAQDPVAPPTSPSAPATPWRLVYQLPAPRSADDPQAVREKTLRILQQRLGTRAVVAPGDGATLTITLADGAAAQVAAARALVEDLALLEMRQVADGEYIADGGKVHFDLTKERQLLQAWLDGGGRDRLQQDPRAIATYRAASEHLRWCVRFVRPSLAQDGAWNARYADMQALATSVVAAYPAADWNEGMIPATMRTRPIEQQFLIELLAINRHELHFTGDDLDPESIVQSTDPNVGSAVDYRMRREKAVSYANFSEKLIGRCCAILWNDEVLVTPCFASRIEGVGRIAGLTATQAATIAKILATPLAERMQLLRSEAVVPR